MNTLIKILENAGLVDKKRDGQYVMYEMKTDTLSGTPVDYTQQVCSKFISLKKERKMGKNNTFIRCSQID